MAGNRIRDRGLNQPLFKKLEKNHAPQEQLQRAKAALQQFRKEAGSEQGIISAHFTNRMIGQKSNIQEICKKI